MRKGFITLFAMAVFGLTALHTEAQEITGYSDSKDYEIKDFSELEIRSNFKVELQQGSEFRITAYFNGEEDSSRIKVVKQGNTAIISYEQDRDKIFWERNKEDVTLLIQVPELSLLSLHDKVNLKSAGEFKTTKINLVLQDNAQINGIEMSGEFIDVTTDNGAEIHRAKFDFVKGEYMIRGGSKVEAESNILENYATVGGTARLTLNSGEMDSFRVQLSTSGKLEIRGKGCDALNIEGSGMSEYNGTDFPIGEADINISGTVKVKLLMEEGGTINAVTKGMSTVKYKGNNVTIKAVDSKAGSIKNI